MKHKSGLVRNCGVLKRCMSILLALAMVVTLMPAPQAKAEAETRAAATTKIHFRDESKAYWGAPRFWAWTDDGDYISSGWDGRPTMQPEGDGWYVYESSVPVGSNMGVLFTNPDDSKQKTDRIELKKVGNTNTKPVIGLEVRVENSNVTIVNPGTEVEVAEPEKRESPVISGKQVNFNYYAPYAEKVEVRGSFNGWSDTNPMQKDGDGWWTLAVPLTLEEGSYEYKFVENGGSWKQDPLNDERAGDNSAFTIYGEAGPVEPGNNEPLVVKLHYNRPDGNYNGWSVWMWEENGRDIPFVNENGEMVATFTIENRSSSRLGYIIKKGEWEDKDPNMSIGDQFISLGNVIAGTLHYYVNSGTAGGNYNYDEAVQGAKILSAKYDRDAKTVQVKLASACESEFTLNEVVNGQNGKEVKIDRMETSDNVNFTLHIDGGLNDFGAYSITSFGYSYHVEVPSVYSMEFFENENTYAGNDLGAVYTPQKTSFRVWAPTATEVNVKIYTSGTEGTDDCEQVIPMTKDVQGTWIAELAGDANGKYYTYEAAVQGKVNETCDPYGRTTGVNGKRSMVIDLAATNPAGWENDKNPNPVKSYTDAVLYELHVRDLSMNENSGIQNKGKFLGLTEPGTKTPGGSSTGLDHIKELGITHLHLLPSYDYGSVDETRLEDNKFNWGYDPVNYNVPEGSYSTDPYKGEVRVKEMKQMVKTLHDNGISVVMDVVYNHVQDADKFSVNQLVPGYFTRPGSNGSGCGNDVASERSMVSKYIVDSVNYWADEYHIDGFRFDLVGLIDAATIQEVVRTVHEKHPNVIFYGEGWEMGTKMTKPGNIPMANYKNPIEGFAYFSDTIRDTLKGNVNDLGSSGFISGSWNKTIAGTMVACMKGLTHSVVNPNQVVNYASCHDNYTLKDMIDASQKNASETDRIKMNNLAAAVYMTAQGIPFIHAGEEILRIKENADGSINHNSYNSPDSVNCIKWGTKDDPAVNGAFEYYKGLIAFRKAHSGLRYGTQGEVDKNVFSWTDVNSSNAVLKMHITADGTDSDGIYMIFNASNTNQNVELPKGNWSVCVQGDHAGTARIGEVINAASDGAAKINVERLSATILVNNLQEEPEIPEPEIKPEITSFTAHVASPQPKKSTVKLTVNAAGEGKLQYRFYRTLDGVETVFRDYNPSNIAYCNPPAAGDYTLYVDVKDEKGNVTTAKMDYTWENKLANTTFTASSASPQTKGTTIKLTAMPNGGENLQYRFYRELDGKVTVFRDYSPYNIAYCNPPVVGNYILYVDVKDASGTVITERMEYEWK